MDIERTVGGTENQNQRACLREITRDDIWYCISFNDDCKERRALRKFRLRPVLDETRRFRLLRPRGGKSHESHVCGTDMISAARVTGESLCASAEIMSGVPANCGSGERAAQGRHQVGKKEHLS